MSLPARNTDPYTSHLAAAHVVDKGIAAKQQRQAAAAVANFPNRTCTELHQISGLDLRMLTRRLGEAAKAGLIVRGDVRKCQVTGRLAATWRPC